VIFKEKRPFCNITTAYELHKIAHRVVKGLFLPVN